MVGKLLSIYITNDIIRVCEVRKLGAAVTINRAFEIEIPSGTVEDGVILDEEKLSQILGENLALNGIKKGKLSFVISSRKIASKEIIIPFVKNLNKVDEIIRSNLDEYFPMNNIGDYICRHTILDTFTNAEGKHYSVSVMAVQKQMIEGYYAIAGLLKMPVETIDFYGNSIYQLLKKQVNQGTVLALQMDTNVTYVSIMCGQAMLFRRSVPFGSDTFIQSLVSLKGITESEAYNILRDPDKIDTALTVEEYIDIIKDFSASVTRVVEFYASRNPGTVIELCKLLGTGVIMVGFSELLGKELGIDVIPVKEISNVKITKKNRDGLNYENTVKYLPNVGVMFGSLDLKPDSNKKKTIMSGYGIFYFAIILAAVSSISLSTYLIIDYNKLKEDKEALEKEIAGLNEAEAIYNAYTTAESEYNIIKNYYDSTVNPNESLYRLILELEEITPKSVGISTFTSTSGEISMTCIANGKEPVAAFVIALKKVPYITNVKVQNISDTYDEAGQITSTFNMTFNISWQADAEEGEEVQE